MCGKRSAWSRKGGYAPLCFPNDITPNMILDFKNSHSNGDGDEGPLKAN
jgi:hypothetical protein